MTTPLKPWERSANGPATPRVTSASSQPPQFSLSSRMSAGNTTSTAGATTVSSVPAIPPRSATSGYLSSQPYAPGFGSYGGGYSSYGGGYGGSYGGGGYGYGYRPYGGMYGGGFGNVESPFLQQAEESTRSAFQSVESVVGAFSSISAMLESTYFAVHSCFRAVLGVAQHFTRLRNYVWGIVSAVALFSRLRYFLRKLLRLLRLREDAGQEEVWEESTLEQSGRLHPPLSSPDNRRWEGLPYLRVFIPSSCLRVWPAVLFFVMVFGVPWVLWRLLTALSSPRPESDTETWSEETEQPPTVARALYDFTPQHADELGFSAGDELVLAPRQLQTGWALAGKDRKSGLIPMNYIQVLQPTTIRRPGSGTPPTSATPPNDAPPSSPPDGGGQQLHDQETLLND